MNFVLREGEIVVVPDGPLVALAKKPGAEDGQTPWTARLRQIGDNTFAFRTRTEVIEEGHRDFPGGRVVFVPAGIKAGDRLVVAWVAPKCACLKRAGQ